MVKLYYTNFKPSNGPLLVNNSLMKFGSRSLSILWKSAVSRYIEKRARYAWQICKWKSDRRFLANVIAARAIFYTRDDKIVEFYQLKSKIVALNKVQQVT